MIQTTSTDEVIIEIVNSTDLCADHGIERGGPRPYHTVVAKITVTMDGRTFSRMACKQTVDWYMNPKGVVNSAGENIPVRIA